MQIPIPVFKLVEWNATFSDGLILAYLAAGLFLAILRDYLYKKRIPEAEWLDRFFEGLDRFFEGYFTFVLWPITILYTANNLKSHIKDLENENKYLLERNDRLINSLQKKKRRAK